MHILFVCRANVYRSRLAEAYALQKPWWHYYQLLRRSGWIRPGRPYFLGHGGGSQGRHGWSLGQVRK